MIKITVDLQDWDDGYAEKTVTIPSDKIYSELSRRSEYAIIDSSPFIPGLLAMDIWRLNAVIEEINNENPGMTAELLGLILEAVDGDLEDEEVVRRIKENDFLFEDLSEITWKMTNEEIAACYIATELEVPFDTGITKEILKFIGRDEITDYIDWSAIWSQYKAIGFKLAEDMESSERSLYLIHWR